MALDPNVVVVAPGELITATHLNNIRANLDRIDQVANQATEVRTTALTLTSAGLTTTPITVPNASTTGTRGFHRLIIATAGLLVTGAAGNLDLYLTCTNTAAGASKRTRYAGAVSGFLQNSWIVAAGQNGTVSAQLGTSTGTATVSTVGSTDLNYIELRMIPAPAYLVIP